MNFLDKLDSVGKHHWLLGPAVMGCQITVVLGSVIISIVALPLTMIYVFIKAVKQIKSP